MGTSQGRCGRRASANASGSPAAGSLEHFQSLYDSHRFLDLYSLTSEYWNRATDVSSLPVDALVLGGRLAGRLGGARLSRWLLRGAFQRDPSDPRVRCFAHHLNPLRVSFLDDLRDFIAHPDLGGEDAALRASWYAQFAVSWAALRDFERAAECLRAAFSLAPDDGWVLHMESVVHGLADRWTDALRSAERAREIDPGAPFVAYSLGASLVNLGRVEESAARLFAAAESCQSYEIVLMACWHQCALAETVDGGQKRSALDRARGLAARLPGLMPLADRETLKLVARTNLDIAGVADDAAGIERWISEVHSPFHRQLLANLARNTGGRRVRLPYRRTLQKYNACVPASLAAAMSAGGMHISADEMAAEITFGGTYEWAAADWLRARGYHVRFFFATPEVAADLIRNGIAFVVSWESEESGHAVAIVGIDERAGTLLAHDPQSFRGTEYLLSSLDPLASPIGIKGMAVVTRERATTLDSLLPPESAVMAAAQEQSKQMMLHGPSASRQVVVDLLDQFPSHPGSKCLEATQALEDGQVGQALGELKALMRQFPMSPSVRVRFMAACHALGNTALARQALKDIVEAGLLPGVEAQQEWIYAPDRYVYEYADLLRLSSDTRPRAESLLLRLIQRQGTSAGAWHNLADLLWQKQDRPGALLSYRISSCLAESEEHYACAYADALAAERREEEGLLWLESRARRFRNTPHSVGTWVSWISALEGRGYPERALSACNEALAQPGASPELLSFAVPFFARMGDWTRAEAERERLRNAGVPRAFHEASAHLHRMRGDLEGAASHAAAWIAELPRSIEARRTMLDIMDAREGHEAAVRASRQWMLENRNHEDFEGAYCAQLDRASAPRWKKYSVVLRRLKRNPEDAWAWRDLTFDCLYEYEIGDDRKRKRLEPRIARYLAECDRTSAGTPPTVRAHALWAELHGDWAAAAAQAVESIALDPEAFYGYKRAWECSSRFKAEEREALWNRMEPLLVNSSGRLGIAREVAGLIAERFGIAAAEKNIEDWRAARPEDPDVLEAAADLLIEHGHGRSDAARAIGMLEPAVLRYPYHSGLRFSLAKAFRTAGRDADAEGVLAEIARRHPDSTTAKIQLAWISSRKGDVSGACEFLDHAMAAEPRNSDLLDSRAQILMAHARYDEALLVIEGGLQRLPMDVHWRDRAAALLAQCGAADKAIQALRNGLEAGPRSASLWLVLGRTLHEMRHYAEVGEIESCLRKSLELNSTLFEAADLLAVFLTEQRQYDEASKILLDIESRMADPCPARGRLAWVRRQRGQKSEALSDLANVLGGFPWYGWGWGLLMAWLEEDAAWDQTRRLLQTIPPPMFTNTAFRVRRLWLLEMAKADAKQLDEEWDGLLRDFPEDAALHQSRYDVLAGAQRWKEAAAVIDAIARVQPGDPFVLARLCEVLSRDGHKDAAREIALRVCFLPAEEQAWPAEKVWDVARRDDFAADLTVHFNQRLLAGDKPTLQAFSCLAAYAMRDETKGRTRPRTAIRFPPDGVRELMRLVQEVSGAPWDGSGYRAVAYSLLCDYGFSPLVPTLSAKIDSAAVTAADEWAQIGRAYVDGHRYDEARMLLGAWRERPGVAMWMVTNYVLSLSRSRPDQLQERYSTARDALAGLPHDRCARYLAHVQAEAAALLDHKEEFLETWASHAGYFDGRLGDGEFFADEDRHLLASVPKVADGLARHPGKPVRAAFRKFRRRRAGAVPARPALKGDTRTGRSPNFFLSFLLATLLIRIIMSFTGSGTSSRWEPDRDRPSYVTKAPLSFSLHGPDLVANVTPRSFRGDSYGATGEVINRGDKTFHFVIVKVEFCDKMGRVVGTLMTEGRKDEYVLPGTVKPFSVQGKGRLEYATIRAAVAYAVEVK